MITGDAREHVFRDSFGLRVKVPVEWETLRRIVPEGIRFRGNAQKKYDVKARRWAEPRWVRKTGMNYITLHTVSLERVEPTPARFTETWAWIPIYLNLGSGSLPSANWAPISWASGLSAKDAAVTPGWSKEIGVSKVSRNGDDIEASLRNSDGELIFSAAATLNQTEQLDYRSYTMWNLTSNAPTRLTGSVGDLPLFLQETHFVFQEKKLAAPGTGKIHITDADPLLSSLGLSGIQESEVVQWQGGRFDLRILAVDSVEATRIIDPMAKDS